VSELFTPVAGEVTAVNGDLANHPESINAKPHDAWMIKIRPRAAADLDQLLDAAGYAQIVK
jgi:glycine cleavage system H protein